VIGYKLGGVPIIRHNFEKVILGIIVLSLLPSVIEVVKAGRASAR
jgi:membrane-associated protein